MKILIVLPQLRTGGGQKLALDVAIGLSQKGADVTILSLYAREDTVFTHLAEKSGLNLIFLDKGEGKSLRMFSQVCRVVKAVKPDVIHTHLMALPYVLPAVFLYKIPAYHTLHTLAAREAQGLMRFCERLAYKCCGFTPIAISPYCRTTVSELYHIPEDKIPVIFNGVDTKRYACRVPYEERDRSMLTVISTGRLDDPKRQDLLIDAFAAFHKQYPQSQLILLGDGPHRAQIENQIHTLGLDHAVRLPGIVSNVEEYLNNAHLFVLASDWEGLPLSVLEAMSCGIPVVATRAGGTVDIVPDTVGRLVTVGDVQELTDAMCLLAEDFDLRAKMSCCAIETAASFDIANCVDDHARLFGLNEQ